MKNFTLFTLVMAAFIYMGCDTAKKTSKSASDSAESTMNAGKIDIEGEFVTGGAIGFEAANERYNADGKFNKWHFTKVSMEKKNIESLEATIAVDLASIWEKNDDLTNHLKAPDFFNIEKFTTATIDIKNVKPIAEGVYKADMVLNMKGLTQEMSSEFIVSSMEPYHVIGKAQVSRKLFGLGSEEMGVGEYMTVAYDTDIPVGE